MPDNVPWSDDTDPFISDLDDALGKKYDVSIRELLTNPGDFVGKKDIADKANGLKSDVDAYFQDLESSLSAEKDEFTKELEGADALYTKIEQAVSNKAAIAKVPYIRPLEVDISLLTPEIMYVDDYTNTLDAIILKMINSSDYIANISTAYQKYNIGSWFFCGERSHIISIQSPESILIPIEKAWQEISDLFEDALITVSGPAPPKSK